MAALASKSIELDRHRHVENHEMTSSGGKNLSQRN